MEGDRFFAVRITQRAHPAAEGRGEVEIDRVGEVRQLRGILYASKMKKQTCTTVIDDCESAESPFHPEFVMGRIGDVVVPVGAPLRCAVVHRLIFEGRAEEERLPERSDVTVVDQPVRPRFVILAGDAVVLVVVRVKVHDPGEFLLIVEAVDGPGAVACLVERRQQQRRQNRDDGDDDQEFDKREHDGTETLFHKFNLPVLSFGSRIDFLLMFFYFLF